jgi:ribosome maturation factor RimP
MGRPSRGSSDSASGAASEVRSVLEPVVAALGLDLEDLDVQASGRRRRVSVVIDRDGGVDLDGIAAASRAVSDAVDASDAMGDDPYTLEVTSPGVDRPLTLPRHWHRNIGRRVRVHLANGSTLEGRVREVDDGGVLLAVDVKGKPESTERRTPWSDVVRGEVQVEFRRAQGTDATEDESVSDGLAGDADDTARDEEA